MARPIMTVGEARREHLIRFYALLDRLERGIGGARKLADCSGRMVWPTAWSARRLFQFTSLRQLAEAFAGLDEDDGISCPRAVQALAAKTPRMPAC